MAAPARRGWPSPRQQTAARCGPAATRRPAPGTGWGGVGWGGRKAAPSTDVVGSADESRRSGRMWRIGRPSARFGGPHRAADQAGPDESARVVISSPAQPGPGPTHPRPGPTRMRSRPLAEGIAARPNLNGRPAARVRRHRHPSRRPIRRGGRRGGLDTPSPKATGRRSTSRRPPFSDGSLRFAVRVGTAIMIAAWQPLACRVNLNARAQSRPAAANSGQVHPPGPLDGVGVGVGVGVRVGVGLRSRSQSRTAPRDGGSTAEAGAGRLGWGGELRWSRAADVGWRRALHRAGEAGMGRALIEPVAVSELKSPSLG